MTGCAGCQSCERYDQKAVSLNGEAVFFWFRFAYTLGMVSVFGIGNPLIDVVFHASDEDLVVLGLDKGIMHLVSQDRQQEILQHFSGKEPQYHPGGSGPNTLLALAGLGTPGVICGKIGNDGFGLTYDRQVRDYGITSRLVRGEGATGSSIILVTDDGERTMNTHLGMCQEFGTADLDEPLLRETVRGGGILYFTGYMWDTETQKAAIRRAMAVTREEGGRIVFDLADPFAVERYRSDFLELLGDWVDVVFANGREAAILLDLEGDAAAGALAEMVDTVALKAGKDGSVLAWKDGDGALQFTRVGGNLVVPRDTTGAGDMYAAGFLAGMARGFHRQRCGEIAGLLAEEIIQRTGAQFDVATITSLRNGILGEGTV